jgi:DNA-binding response OmpR family regulator
MNDAMLTKLSKYRVLYAEDDDGVRKNVNEMLSLLFSEVLLAKDGEQAYELFKNNQIDLIITDIKMPKLSGIELAKKIRKEDKNVEIIIISAHTEVDFMLQAVELNLVRYIVKPITETKLLEALAKFLEAQEDQNQYILENGWVYDSLEKIIINEKESFELTKKEAKFLDMLLKKKNVLSYEEIETALWGDEYMSLNALRLMIKNFRKKLPQGSLKNIQGFGYKL